MHPYDVIFLGLAFDIVAGFILARGLLFKRLKTVYQEALAPLGGNSLIIKNSLLQRAETFVGTVALLVGFILQMLGTLHGGATASELGWVNSIPRFAVILLAPTLLTWAASLLAAHYARVQFFRFWMRNHKEGEPLADQKNDPTWLDRNAEILGLERGRGENDETFRARIEERRLKLGRKYGGYQPGFRVHK